MNNSLFLTTLTALYLAPSVLMAVPAHETYIDLTTGATGNNPPEISHSYADSWNQVAVTTGGAGASAPWHDERTFEAIQLKDFRGADSYQLTVSKKGTAGVWDASVAVPALPNFTVSESVGNSQLGGNNGTNMAYTLSGFTAGDTIGHLVIGGYAKNTSGQQFSGNVFTLTITGATLASTDNISLLKSADGQFTETWSIVDDNTVTLTLTNPQSLSQDVLLSFAADLSGLVMTRDELSIQYGTSVCANGGANSGLSYIGLFPEPTTGSLSLLSLGLLCMRRRRR